MFGRACGAATSLRDAAAAAAAALPAWDESRVTDADEEVVIAHNWDELRRFMWNYVGIVRTTKRLERAQHRIALLQEEIHEYYAQLPRHAATCWSCATWSRWPTLIVRSALSRHESRGLHFSRDYPDTLPKALPTVLTPPVRPAAPKL